MELAEYTDVVVCGAGPVGLLTALGLAQQGIDTLIFEKRERHVQEAFGRASTLYPRTMELLEQLDVAEEMAQTGFVGRTTVTYRDGKRVARKAGQTMFSLMDDSFHNYILNIRQKNSEHIFASKYEADFGKCVHYGWEIIDHQLDESSDDGYNVTAIVSHGAFGKRAIRCKYLVGADGGNSSVRELANIAMQGNETTYRWVRIDGRMKTDIPDPNVAWAILETKTHGNVLWVKLDRDAFRVGFVLSPALQAKYPDGITQDESIQEAVAAFNPFQLEVQRVDWWTQYNVKQKVTSTFHKNEYIILAGDAAHTHSSAFAQGMNTGVHDATNLAWKLAGTLKGWYRPAVLKTYARERRAAAEKLISIDRLAAAALSGDMPAGFNQTPGLSTQDALRMIIETNMSFMIGLGISYDEPSVVGGESTSAVLMTGSRCPDALLRGPGPSVPVRLQSIMNRGEKGRWNILVFAGHFLLNKSKVAALREKMTASDSMFASWGDRLKVATILVGHVGSVWDAFDGPAVGNMYFDTEATAHARYGVSLENGCIVVVRPDGVFAVAAELDELDPVQEFFEQVFV